MRRRRKREEGGDDGRSRGRSRRRIFLFALLRLSLRRAPVCARHRPPSVYGARATMSPARPWPIGGEASRALLRTPTTRTRAHTAPPLPSPSPDARRAHTNGHRSLASHATQSSLSVFLLHQRCTVAIYTHMACWMDRSGGGGARERYPYVSFCRHPNR